MARSKAQKQAQQRYDVKRPIFVYRATEANCMDIEALRANFSNNQAMMDYLINLGLQAHRYRIFEKNT